MKDLEYYLNLPWTFTFKWDLRDLHYVASVEELAGCKTCGKTIDEAALMIKDALKECIETLLEFGDPIPEPAKPSDFKGNITYRTTPEKHYKLHQLATIQGISINKLIDKAVNEIAS